MNADKQTWFRLAVLATLVKRAPHPPGRTAMMKFAYLLQTLRDVPLGYRFRLYNYGPYDSAVLNDLSRAETLRAVKEKTVAYPTGDGYQYLPKDGEGELCQRAADELARFNGSIDWLLERFGSESACRLELFSTIVYAEREMRAKSQPRSRAELCRRVQSIKPYFEAAAISTAVDALAHDGLIEATSA